MVVDDELLVADTLVDILNGEGYKAVAVLNGASAIKWARMIEPDIVITDVIMPEINGIDTAKAILELIPACRIILFSGRAASLDLLEQARKDGFQFEVLAKPINPDRLLNILDGKRYSVVNK